MNQSQIRMFLNNLIESILNLQINFQVREVYDSVSESELDDAWRVALHSRTKLNEVKQRFRNMQDDEEVLDLDSVSINKEELVIHLI